MELENEHSTLVEKINQTVSAFDEAVYDLRREKIKLDSDLKTAELRMLTFFEELSLLKEFQKKDTSLAARMEKTKKEKTNQKKINKNFHYLFLNVFITCRGTGLLCV